MPFLQLLLIFTLHTNSRIRTTGYVAGILIVVKTFSPVKSMKSISLCFLFMWVANKSVAHNVEDVSPSFTAKGIFDGVTLKVWFRFNFQSDTTEDAFSCERRRNVWKRAVGLLSQPRVMGVMEVKIKTNANTYSWQQSGTCECCNSVRKPYTPQHCHPDNDTTGTDVELLSNLCSDGMLNVYNYVSVV